MFYVGIDVAKSKHDCFIIDSDGVIHMNNLRISNDRKGFDKLLEAILNALDGDSIQNTKVGLEHTGHYSINIKRFLESQGFVVTNFNPLETNAFRKASTLRKGYRGKYGREKAVALRKLAADSIGLSDNAYAFELQQTIRMIQNVQAEIDVLDKKIESIVNELNTPLLSIPGISYTLATIILAEIGENHNFSIPSKLQAFAGLDPSTYQSGKYTASHSTMVKRGSTYLRWAMFQAARLVAMRDKTFADYLAKKRSEGKHFNVTLSHVSKKLLRTIFYLLKHNESFVSQG